MALGSNLSVSGLVIFGTFTSLAAKIVYELDGEGIDGKKKHFEKPWTMTTVMFVGMTFCLPLAYYVEYREKLAAKQAASSQNGTTEEDGLTAPLLANGDGNNHTNTTQKSPGGIKEVLMLAIPTLFDLIATILMNIGLLTTTASVYQMLRGAEMLFAALFAVVFLKRRLNKYHYSGIGCCIFGITLVGTSSLLSGEGSASHDVDPARILFGMALIVLSQAVQAAQITFEDFFMADLAVPPLKIVGYEGLFGSIAMLGVMLPLVQHLPGEDGQGIHEDSYDTWHMLKTTPAIVAVLAIDLFALLAYNISGMCVTGHLGAVFRTVLETTRTLFVWLVDLLLFYTPLGMGKLGESWSRWSIIQLAGFIVLVTGTVVYGKGDEKEIEEEMAHLQGEEGAPDVEGWQRQPSGPMAIHPRSSPATTTTVPIGIASSSLKASRTINAASYSSSVSRSINRSLIARQRLLLSPPANAAVGSNTNSNSQQQRR